MKRPLKNRDINWLYFNERVLMEAQNPNTPLFERIKFLAIFSSNLDEYFKVRISQLRQLKKMDKKLRKKLELKPNKKLKFILKTIERQQAVFGDTLREVVNSLRTHDIYIREPDELNPEQLEVANRFFEEHVLSHCTVVNTSNLLNFKDGCLYLVALAEAGTFDIFEIPVDKCGRFIEMPGTGHNYLFLDDLLKLNLHRILPEKKLSAGYTIKMSRDAELYLDDDYTNAKLVDKIYRSLGKRESGQPTRLLYDEAMPESIREKLQRLLDLGEADMMAGAAYHNLSDLFGFPHPEGAAHLRYQEKQPLLHPKLSTTEDIFQTVLEKDQLVHFPFQEFAVVERFIHEAASDTSVTHIKMTLYRIAKSSKLTDALLLALKNGKKVTLFIEAQARFDERNNIKWGRIFENNGAAVLYSIPNIKVHSKVALVERLVEGGIQRFAFIGTGNFNAKTAKIYADHGLFTAHGQICSDLDQVFQLLNRTIIAPKTKYLLISPFTTRLTLMEHIDQEIEHVKAGHKGKITLKMNSLEDTKMIQALYRASEAGVEIRLLVRGFCCLQPKPSEELLEGEKPIYVTSIIDRYLEHGRIYLFENGGNELMYIGSADWMTRNLDKRVEVLTPILDRDIFQELKDILDLQLNDTVKARIIDENDTNQKVQKVDEMPEIRSQYAIYDYLKEKLDANG
ncbi:MAG: polyphosphate kinase 1 [Bacteroidota bacterium]